MYLLKKLFKNRDRRVSVIVFIFAVVWLNMAKDIRAIFTYAGNRDPGSRLFPYIVGILLLVTSVGKFLTSNQEDEDPFFEDHRGWVKLLAVFVLLTVYVYVYKKIGYLLSTFVTGILCVLLLKEDRKLKWYSPVLFSGILTGSMYLLFGKLLNIVLPVGTLWKLFR